MANLKDIRDRIKSVKSIQKVTKAMKMVAAAKMRKAQERMEQVISKSQLRQNQILEIFRGAFFPCSALLAVDQLQSQVPNREESFYLVFSNQLLLNIALRLMYY